VPGIRISAGIAAAARARVESDRTDETHRCDRSLFELVARHGSGEDLDWLQGLVDSMGSQRRDALVALTAAGNPLGPERFRLWAEKGWLQDHMVTGLVRIDPEASRGVLERAIRGELPREYRDVRRLFRAYGRCVPEDGLGEARSFLLSLHDPALAVSAVYAVTEMHRRDLDVSRFGEIIEAPVLLLERANPETEEEVVEQAMRSITGCEVTWSERALAALERAADLFPELADRVEAVMHIERIRKRAASHWR
jgi:hypothetical protein